MNVEYLEASEPISELTPIIFIMGLTHLDSEASISYISYIIFIGFQRTDGVFGSLVVRSGSDPLTDLYDVDDPDHVFVLTDWLEDLGIVKFVNHHHTVVS